MQPLVGPVSFSVVDVDVTIDAGETLGPILFRWPRPLFVTSILLLSSSGQREAMASMRLRIQDETSQDFIVDGIGGHEFGALGLSGLLPLDEPMFGELVIVRPFEVQRPVMTGDQWFITIENRSEEDSVRPELIFNFAEGEE